MSQGINSHTTGLFLGEYYDIGTKVEGLKNRKSRIYFNLHAC